MPKSFLRAKTQSKRLEQSVYYNPALAIELTSRILGDRLNVVGVVERDQQRGEKVLSIKRADSKAGYSNTKIFSSLDEAGSVLSAENNLPK